MCVCPNATAQGLRHTWFVNGEQQQQPTHEKTLPPNTKNYTSRAGELEQWVSLLIRYLIWCFCGGRDVLAVFMKKNMLAACAASAPLLRVATGARARDETASCRPIDDVEPRVQPRNRVNQLGHTCACLRMCSRCCRSRSNVPHRTRVALRCRHADFDRSRQQEHLQKKTLNFVIITHKGEESDLNNKTEYLSAHARTCNSIISCPYTTQSVGRAGANVCTWTEPRRDAEGWLSLTRGVSGNRMQMSVFLVCSADRWSDCKSIIAN